MRSAKKNRFLIYSILCLATLRVLSPFPVLAQEPASVSTQEQEENLGEEPEWVKIIQQETSHESLTNRIFPNTKRGCTDKSTFFMAMGERYKEGATVAEVANMKVIEPFIEAIYKKIDEQGIFVARLGQLAEYQNCLKTAKPSGSGDRAIKEDRFYESCGRVANIVLGTLENIDRKVSVDRTVSKYEKVDIDGDTLFKDVPEPQKVIVERLYERAENDSREVAIEEGISTWAHCVSLAKFSR